MSGSIRTPSTLRRRVRAAEKNGTTPTDARPAAHSPDVVGYQELVGAAEGSASLGTSYLGLGASVLCAIEAVWGLAVFAAHLDDYPNPAPAILAWILFVGAFAILNISIARRGERLSTRGFAAYISTLAIVVALDFVAIAPLWNVGTYATASIAAGFGLLRIVPLRPPREVFAVTLALLAAFVLMTGNNVPLTVANPPRQILTICLPVFAPLVALFVVKEFRRVVQLDLDRVRVQSTISAPKSAVGMFSALKLPRLDSAAEELLEAVANGDHPLPLDRDTSALAESLAAEFRKQLIEDRGDTWLHHAATESAHLARSVRLSDTSGLANLLNSAQRDGLLEALWLLVADAAKHDSLAEVVIGPVPRNGVSVGRTIAFPTVIVAPGMTRQRVDPSTWAAIARLGSFTVSGEGATLRITVQCIVPNPAI